MGQVWSDGERISWEPRKGPTEILPLLNLRKITSYFNDALMLLARKIYPVVFTMSNRFMRYSSVRENGQIGTLRCFCNT